MLTCSTVPGCWSRPCRDSGEVSPSPARTRWAGERWSWSALHSSPRSSETKQVPESLRPLSHHREAAQPSLLWRLRSEASEWGQCRVHRVCRPCSLEQSVRTNRENIPVLDQSSLGPQPPRRFLPVIQPGSDGRATSENCPRLQNTPGYHSGSETSTTSSPPPWSVIVSRFILKIYPFSHRIGSWWQVERTSNWKQFSQ